MTIFSGQVAGRDMVFSISRRRRNVILTCTAVAAGGYASYRLYRSSAFSQKTNQVYVFFKSLSSLFEALSEGMGSAGIVFEDLHAFLLSDRDEVPQSVKQLFKVVGCHEVQKSVSTLSASVAEGFLQSLHGRGPTASLRQEEQSRDWGITGDRQVGLPEKDLSWKDKEEYEGPEEIDGGSWGEFDESSAKGGDEGEWEQSSWKSAGSVLDAVGLQVGTSMAEGIKEELGGDARSDRDITAADRRVEGNLADKFVEKLFSETGKGFASAVVASASRSLVVAVIDHLSTLKQHKEQGLKGEHKSDLSLNLMEFASSTKGRLLMAECIQAFVGTAVAVYLDRTKDTNFFNDLVTGFLKPEHRGPVTELLTTVCSGTAETLLRTSHEVLSSGGDSDPSLNPNARNQSPEMVTMLANLAKQGKLPHPHEGVVQLDSPLPGASYSWSQHEDSASSGILEKDPVSLSFPDSKSPKYSHTNSEPLAVATLSNRLKRGSIVGGRTGRGEDTGSMTLIDGLSRALAVPATES